jgi:transcriptional regulator with XRE-family HTH domain
MNELGITIRRARRKRGLSQAELGKMTGYKGTYIAKIELGRQHGSYFALLKIAKALDIPLAAVFAEFGINHNDPTPKFTPVDYDFSQLPPKLKVLLLELSDVLQRRI